MCASKAPTPIIVSAGNSNLSAHCFEMMPAGLSAEYVSVKRFFVKPFSKPSQETKKSSGGNPPNSFAHNALCPAEHTPRFIACTSVPPVNKNGIQSQCSTQECIAFLTASSVLRMRSNFAQNHSDE